MMSAHEYQTLKLLEQLAERMDDINKLRAELAQARAELTALRSQAQARMQAEGQAQERLSGLLKECAEVLSYCRPSFTHIMGNDDLAMGERSKQGEQRRRYDDLVVALAHALEVTPDPALPSFPANAERLRESDDEKSTH